ncbi:MAG: carbon-nitrogen hydrolase family protein [Candidatus Latescibacterota bacterium]|nr:MAG: carbon-nitrogen hydrolase family protein [Candidatus Latescibacterota bacterium]
MKTTVCEFPNDPGELDTAWQKLVAHVREEKSDVVLLPEMPFYRWLAHSRDFSADLWERAVQTHDRWMVRLNELAPATVVGTRPTTDDGCRYNVGFVWESETGAVDLHAKYYLPDEPGFWEATWYQRGNGDFDVAVTKHCKIGFLICTELWFNVRAREYGKQGADILVCPRATPTSTREKWIVGGQAAAVVSGAFCLSSNLAGTTPEGCDFAGTGWIANPDGVVLGLTSTTWPFLTLDLDLGDARLAKTTYPRYVND